MPSDSSTLRAASQSGSIERLVPLVPSDARDLPGGVCRGPYVDGARDPRVRDAFGGEAVLVSGAGQYCPVARVLSAGPPRGAVVALY